MATDAVQNQKVFITLDGFSQLVTEYRRVRVATSDTAKQLALASNDSSNLARMLARKQALEWVIQILGLPISI